MINHFTRRSFIGLSAVAAASLALAGCSSNNDTAAKTDNAASTTTGIDTGSGAQPQASAMLSAPKDT